jgi:hypothetical protein
MPSVRLVRVRPVRQGLDEIARDTGSSRYKLSRMMGIVVRPTLVGIRRIFFRTPSPTELEEAKQAAESDMRDFVEGDDHFFGHWNHVAPRNEAEEGDADDDESAESSATPTETTALSRRQALRHTFVESVHVATQVTAGGAFVALLSCVYLLGRTYLTRGPFVEYESLSEPVQWLMLGFDACESMAIQFLGWITLRVIFKSGDVRTAFWISLTGALIDGGGRVIYRVMEGTYPPPWSGPVNIVAMMFTILGSCMAVARAKRRGFRFGLNLVCGVMLGPMLAYTFVKLVFPWYLKTDRSTRALLVTTMPFVFVVPNTIARFNSAWLTDNHPGTSFALSAPVIGMTANVVRITQSELGELDVILGTSILFGVIEVIERGTQPLRDVFGATLMQCRRVTIHTVTRPRRKRLLADLVLCGMLFESAGIILSNVAYFSTLYMRANWSFWQCVWGATKQASVQLAMEWLFDVPSLVLEACCADLGVLHAWRRRWRYHVLVCGSIMFVGMLYLGERFMILIDAGADLPPPPA